MLRRKLCLVELGALDQEPAEVVAHVAQDPYRVQDVVGAHVQRHRDHPGRVDDAGRRRVDGVDGELAHRDVDPADTPVTNAEDLLGVGGHQQVHVLGAHAEAAQRRLDLVGRIDGQVHPTRAAVLVAVPLDRLANGRVVHDRQQLAQVVGQHPVVQHFVTVVQLLQEDVLEQVARPPGPSALGA
jgi:hypothetical protein